MLRPSAAVPINNLLSLLAIGGASETFMILVVDQDIVLGLA